jgi:hypothetical protein
MQTPIATGYMANDLNRPIIEPWALDDGSGFYVAITWPDGYEEHVNGFWSFDDAQNWIISESKGWLRKLHKSDRRLTSLPSQLNI